jgi:hypothetical protein
LEGIIVENRWQEQDLGRTYFIYLVSNVVKEDEVGGACSPNGGKEKCV